jgi:hypothetical protein
MSQRHIRRRAPTSAARSAAGLDEMCRVPAVLLAAEPARGSLLERIRVHCPADGIEHTGSECTGCARFVRWGLSTIAGAPWLLCRLPCSSCGDRDRVAALDEVVFCEECRARAGAAPEDDEIEAGV